MSEECTWHYLRCLISFRFRSSEISWKTLYFVSPFTAILLFLQEYRKVTSSKILKQKTNKKTFSLRQRLRSTAFIQKFVFLLIIKLRAPAGTAGLINCRIACMGYSFTQYAFIEHWWKWRLSLFRVLPVTSITYFVTHKTSRIVFRPILLYLLKHWAMTLPLYDRPWGTAHNFWVLVYKGNTWCSQPWVYRLISLKYLNILLV